MGMVELNEKALEAAHHAYEKYGQAGDLKTQRLSDGCMAGIIAAYLAALPEEVLFCPQCGWNSAMDGEAIPAPDELVDPDAYVDWESQCVWRAENIKDPSGLQPVWFAPALQSQAKQIVRLTQERDEALDRHSSAVMGEVEATQRAEAAEQQVQKLTAENEKLREALTPFAFNRARIDLDRFDDETKIEVHFPRSNPRKATPVGWVYVEHVLAARSALETQDDQK